MRISDWSSDVCSSDLLVCNAASNPYYGPGLGISDDQFRKIMDNNILSNHWLITMVAPEMLERGEGSITIISSIGGLKGSPIIGAYCIRSEEHTSELQSLMRISYAVFCLTTKHSTR